MALLHKVRIKVDFEFYRRQAGMSTLKLSVETGIARTSLRRLLKNPGQLTLDQFATLCAVLDVPAEAIEIAA